MIRIFLCIFAILLYSCRKESLKLTTIDYSYVNLNYGYETLYQVDSIHIDAEINVYDTIKFLIKERIDTFFYNYNNTKIYRIERYKYVANNWQLTDVWSCYLYNNRFIKTEENISYIKLVFPAKEGLRWDGNALNNIGPQFYVIDSIVENNNVRTCKIVHKNKETLVDKYYVYEKYAQNVGMIERYEINIYSSYYIPGLPIEKRIKRGDIKIMRKVN
ncbi:MAG: hypothetical protein N3A01_03675 [Bacteroidales bacterium]|nr:hypothetical protein [Bacteroidales bacterium]